MAHASAGTPASPAARQPNTPALGTRVDGPSAIYRCQAGGRTSYSNDPCPGASVVQDHGVVGFDSRPSERLARLVAAGRTESGPLADASSGGSRFTVPPGAAAECARMRRQFADLDRLLLQPNSIPVLDDARQKRQDIRTSMARQHC